MSRAWEVFSGFVTEELAVGGPDPQFKLITHLSRNHDPVERVWLIGCYGAHHCVPSAYAVWSNFRVNTLVDFPHEQERLYTWLDQHWDNLPVRPEMRNHRMIEKRWTCLMDFARYAHSERWKTGTYQEVWDDSVAQVKYYGRYMAIKVLEMLRMSVRPDLVLSDLRAKNAWSPRIALGLLFPDEADIIADRNANSWSEVLLAEEIANEAIEELDACYGIRLSHFQLQVLLCEFRELLVGGFYPGAGHDEEMEYIKIAERSFDMSAVWEARSEIFPHKYLGEKNDWFGLRKEKFVEWKTFGKGVLNA